MDSTVANAKQEGTSDTSCIPEEPIDWEDYFMGIAVLASKRSVDPICKVGACIANPENLIVGVGYNHMPGGRDDIFPWDKTKDVPLTDKRTYVCHAELNAIMNKTTHSLKDCTIYVTHLPCNECAKLIIQSGIKNVVFNEEKLNEASNASKIMFEKLKLQFRFPRDPVHCAQWKNIIALARREEYFDPKNNNLVCSAHFMDITKRGPIFMKLVQESLD